MKVLRVSEDCLSFFADGSGEKHGEIHAVFDRAINVRFQDGTLMTLVSSALDLAPMTCQVSMASFKQSGWTQGTSVVVEAERLSIGSDCLDFKKALIWAAELKSADLPEILPRSLMHQRLEQFITVLLDKGKPEGLLPYLCRTSCVPHPKNCMRDGAANPYVTFIQGRLDQFVLAYRDGSESGDAKVMTAFSRIVGFGPGLTPATDDFVAGFMAASLWAPYGKFMERRLLVQRNQKLAVLARDKTTFVSESMLAHAAHGRIAQKYRSLLELLCYGFQGNLETATLKALDHGDTSGTDFLTGAAVALIMSLDQ
ncbi:DUF2877 domain-containing protein [Acidaminobacter hydrogenoformans]|nr:DUF2877 domain-containing protein [Acidaminobacter hydrogenoformans]